MFWYALRVRSSAQLPASASSGFLAGSTCPRRWRQSGRLEAVCIVSFQSQGSLLDSATASLLNVAATSARKRVLITYFGEPGLPASTKSPVAAAPPSLCGA